MAIGYEQPADAAKALAGEIDAKGGRVVSIQMDAANPTSIKQAVDRATYGLGGLDILVNKAGIWRAAPMDRLTLDDIDPALAVNVRGVILATQAALASTSAGGRIISNGSNPATLLPDAGLSLHSANKAALTGWTKGRARDLARVASPPISSIPARPILT